MEGNKTRLTIGLLIDGLYGMGSYQNEVWKGVLKGAELENANLICFSGGTIKHSPNNPYEEYRNIIYSFINKEKLNGIVFTGLTLGNYVSREEYLEFCRAIEPLPMVSVGGPIFDYTSINIDNRAGLHELLKHLITVHDYKRIAFIKGAEGNKDAEERYEVYKKVLSEYNIPLDEKLVYTGNFMEQSGAACISELIDKRNVKFDVVVASNDNMALGAMAELKRRGFIIPADVAVAGFDDIQDASAVYPALTTIRQPLAMQGEEAVHVLVKKIRKQGFSSVTLPTEPVYRKSCGCQLQDVEKALARSNVIIERLDNIEEDKDKLASEILAVIDRGGSAEYRGLINDLISCIIEDINTPADSGKFLAVLDKIIQAMLRDNIYVSKFQKALSIIRNSFFDYIYCNSDDCGRVENIFQQSRVLVSEMTMYSMTNEKILAERETFILDEISLSLASTFDREELLKIVVKQLARLEVNTIFISLFLKNNINRAKLVLAYQDNKYIDISDRDNIYDPRDLIPPCFNSTDKFNLIVFPLYFKEHQIGVLLIDGKTTKGLIYESLFIKLSSAFEASMIFQDNSENQNMLKHKNMQIQTLVYPMIESINNVSKITGDKIASINKIKEVSKESWDKIIQTAGSIEKTSGDMNNMLELIKVIDDISAKINIVALNASIEAAHVGNYGRGFSIIASEIRKLSELTKKHANEISKTIGGINLNINDSVSTVRESQKSFNDLENGINELLESLQVISQMMKLLEESSNELLKVMNDHSESN